MGFARRPGDLIRDLGWGGRMLCDIISLALRLTDGKARFINGLTCQTNIGNWTDEKASGKRGGYNAYGGSNRRYSRQLWLQRGHPLRKGCFVRNLQHLGFRKAKGHRDSAGDIREQAGDNDGAGSVYVARAVPGVIESAGGASSTGDSNDGGGYAAAGGGRRVCGWRSVWGQQPCGCWRQH